MRRASAMLLAALLSASPVLAAETEDRLDEVLAPGVVGEVLATEALGDTELKPVRPGSLSALVTAVQAFNKDGKVAPGVAMEVTPWALGAAAGFTHKDYLEKPITRAMLRTSLSLATTSEGEGEDSVVRGAAALRIRLWDDSDWRLNKPFLQCAVEAAERPVPPPPPPGEGDVIRPATVSEKYLKAFEECSKKNDVDKPRWNAGQGAFGFAATLRAPGGSLDAAELEKLEAILGLATPLGETAQLLFSARVSRTFPLAAVGEQAATPARTLAGAGARLAYKTTHFIINANAGFGYEHTHAEGSAKGVFGLLLQLPLTESTWVESNVDATFSDKGAPGELVFGSSLKWTLDVVPAS